MFSLLLLLQALPDTEKEIRARLEHLRNEAAPLLLQKQKIDSHAHRWVIIEGGGVAGICRP